MTAVTTGRASEEIRDRRYARGTRAAQRARTPISVGVLLLMLGMASQASAQRQPALNDEQIRQQIVQESIWSYAANGAACGCPFELAPSGSRCGRSSAYNKRDVAHPLCYRADITDRMVKEWKRAHGIR